MDMYRGFAVVTAFLTECQRYMAAVMNAPEDKVSRMNLLDDAQVAAKELMRNCDAELKLLYSVTDAPEQENWIIAACIKKTMQYKEVADRLTHMCDTSRIYSDVSMDFWFDEGDAEEEQEQATDGEQDPETETEEEGGEQNDG